jgi:hypothetical protein
MEATVETLTGSSESSSNSSTSNSDSSNSSAESDVDNSDSEDVRQKGSTKKPNVGEKEEPKDPVEEAKRYNQRYNLLMERINAINQVRLTKKARLTKIK